VRAPIAPGGLVVWLADRRGVVELKIRGAHQGWKRVQANKALVFL